MAIWQVRLRQVIAEWESVQVQAKTKEEAERIAIEQQQEYWEVYDTECLEDDDPQDMELMAEIAAQNIALDRSGGDYWNYDAVEDYYEELK